MTVTDAAAEKQAAKKQASGVAPAESVFSAETLPQKFWSSFLKGHGCKGVLLSQHYVFYGLSNF